MHRPCGASMTPRSPRTVLSQKCPGRQVRNRCARCNRCGVTFRLIWGRKMAVWHLQSALRAEGALHMPEANDVSVIIPVSPSA